MNRAEAIKVLFEINDECKSQLMTCVSVEQPSSQIVKTPDGYQIRMKCDINKKSRNCLKPVLEKHKLRLKEEKGFVIVYQNP